ncbi:Uncharacterised protein [Serratia fonticola]|uniref:Uncharacterized protein n=1 Tax=Serratia fonticola TaxID=47917 RepID=A0A4U9VM63_SERFO|nr:Uncharacterised protein [Serratia fonticola]
MEIGHTWLSQSVQRTGVNTEAKYLLLGYALKYYRRYVYSSPPTN